jgi:acyl-CoA hydrolase
MQGKRASESRVIRANRVFPGDTNNHGTLFGGMIMSEMDMVASISAARHARKGCVTASMDSVEFLVPIRMTDYVCFESFVIWTGTSSMEVFVKVTAEDLQTGERRIAATSFASFIALENGKPVPVPPVIPETEEEKKLHEIAIERAKRRQDRKEISKKVAEFISLERL